MLATGPVLTAIAFTDSFVSLPSKSFMQPSPNHAPWQVAPVSATGRVAAAALALLAIDSVFIWSIMPYLVAAAVLSTIPAVVAIRVIRGFPRSRELATATFALALALASVALSRLGLGAGQASAGIVVAIVLAVTGVLALTSAGLRNQLGREPVIVIPRWPSAPVASRTPSRYRTHRRYR